MNLNRVPARREVRRVVAALSCGLVFASGLISNPASAVEAPAPADGLSGESVESPDGSLVATVGLVDGRLTYGVVRDEDTTVVAPSGLGMTLSEPSVDLTADMRIVSVDRSSTDETWTPAWGPDSQVRNHYAEAIVHAVHEPSDTKLDVTIRVFDDGVGVRYTIPQQASLGQFNVTDEFTGFGLPPEATAYYLRAGTDSNADERHYITAPISSVDTAQTPITLSAGSDLFLSVHEADLTDYPSMTLGRDDSAEGRLESRLTALPGGLKAVLDVTDDAFSTPWRTVTVGRDVGDLADSHLISNLNPACAICDVDSDEDGVDDTTDWITPGTYTGVWWELQRRDTTWTAGANHGATTQRVKEYIDLAAEAGAGSVLAEGWNVNAGGSWANQDFVTPMDDFDLPEVLAYAESQGVGFVAHNETRGNVDYYDEHLEEIFSQYEEWGIHSIKTGYATKFILGGVQRSHFDQEAVRHFRRVIETAAEHDIMINAHESIKPTGLDRTFPNMMTGEGVAGMEQQNYKGPNGNPPEQATILPFTRWMGGAADYTPGVVDVTWDPANLRTRVQTTTATQLALYTTFFSPLQMLADTPENYAAHPTAFAYLKDMPATWDESDVLDAKIGDYTVTARRSDKTWYLGAITDENDRTVDVPLTFLDPDTTYVADVFADAADATWKGNPTALKRTQTIVDSSDTLSASMVAAGGQAARFSPATPEQIASLPEFAPASLTLRDTPTSSYDPLSRDITVTADVSNGGTGVSWAYLYLDGKRIDSTRTRVDGSSNATVTMTLPAASTSYVPSHDLAIGDGASAPGESIEVQLLPFPDQDLIDLATDLIASGDLDPEVGQRIERLLQGAVQEATGGDLTAVELKMQSVRLQLLSSSPELVRDDALAELDAQVERWLGEPIGLMRILSSIRAAEIAGDLAPETARAWREDAAAAARAAIRDDAAAKTAALAALQAKVISAGDSSTVSELRSLVTRLQNGPEVLEMESGTLTGGTSVSTEHAGYTGSGFVKAYTATGACVQVDPSAAGSGRFLVTVRFANGMVIEPLDRQLTMSIGSQDSKISFPNQGQDANRWKRWADTEATRFAVASGDQVDLCYQGDDSGNINADSISLTPDPGVIVRTTQTELPTVVTTVDPATPTGEQGWWTSAVTVTAEAGGAEGAQAQLRIDDGAWATVAGPIAISTDGEHEVFARAVTDDETSPTETVNLKIDTTTPVSSAEVDPSNRTVTARAADETSGLASIEVRLTPDADFTTYDGPIVVGDEETTLTFRSVDRAGNVEEPYDLTVPSIDADLLETTTSATGPDDEVPFGSTAPLQVQVTSSEGQPSGWVEVVEGETVLGRAALTDGRASIDVPGLSVGSHELTVRYGGNESFATSSDTLQIQVRQAESATELELPGRTVAGEDVAARITVDAGDATADGAVQIRSGSTVVAEGTLIDGSASVLLPASVTTRPGPVELQAVYPGSENIAGSSSPSVTLTVEAGPIAALRVEPSATSVGQGGTLAFTTSGVDRLGNPLGDVTSDVTLSSSVETDLIKGNRVTFPTASPHTITATHPATGVTGTVTIEVVAPGPDDEGDGSGGGNGSDGQGSGTGSGPDDVGGSSDGFSLPDTGGPTVAALLLAAVLLGSGVVLVRRRRP